MSNQQPTCPKCDANKRYPIQGGPSVLWSVMAPYESAAKQNHDQTLAQLAERGGLSPSEAMCLAEGITEWRERVTRIQELEAKWIAFAERQNGLAEQVSSLRSQLAAVEGERDAALTGEMKVYREQFRAIANDFAERESRITGRLDRLEKENEERKVSQSRLTLADELVKAVTRFRDAKMGESAAIFEDEVIPALGRCRDAAYQQHGKGVGK